MEGFELVVAGECMIALPGKALWWPAESTLFVADVHLGKDASLQVAGIPVPLGPSSETLRRLSDLLSAVQPERLALLGDLWHAKAGRTKDLVADFVRWRTAHAAIEMLLVEGNHDAKSGPLPESIGVQEVKEPHEVGPFALCHYPLELEEKYVLCGHIHPGVVLEGRARQSMRLPCFWFGGRIGVLPSFGSFTGCGRVYPASEDRVLVVVEDRVISISTSGQKPLVNGVT